MMQRLVTLVEKTESPSFRSLGPFGKYDFAKFFRFALLQESGNIGRIVFAVAVHDDHRLAGKVGLDVCQAHGNGPLMPEVSPQLKKIHPTERAERRKRGRAVVSRGGTVVNQQHIGDDPVRLKLRINIVQQLLHRSPIVENRKKEYKRSFVFHKTSPFESFVN
jgi:hypothetical protein